MGLSGWLIALLVILVVFIIIMIVLAIVSSSGGGEIPVNGGLNGLNGLNGINPKVVQDKKRNVDSGSDSQVCRNIDILYANISLSTGEFIQNAKNGSKRVGNSFKNMNKHAVSIGEAIQNINGKHGNEYADCLLQKNQIYKNLVEYIIVKQKTLSPNDHLLHGLNDINEKMANILVEMNSNVSFDEYVNILHQYDVLVVKQIHFTNENDFNAADEANQQAQIVLITISSNSCK